MAGATEISIEQKLKALYKLQLIDSKIDTLRSVRGELPMEVSDLEDEIAGYETRLGNVQAEINC
jgi:predicted  nucleic acid-binding Zn-ribbon protein